MIDKLKSEIEIRFGRKISYQKDCNILSSCILNHTKEYLSPATLRRVFGFLTTNSNPSRVTLDILSRYIGFNDWEDFNKNSVSIRIKSDYSVVEYWEMISENAGIISSNTIEQIRIKSGIEFEKTIKRAFAKDRLKSFTSSNFSATAFIAPGGYGKSTMMAHWFLSRNKKKNKTKDIILFISAQMLDQFAPTEVFMEVWLMRLLGIKSDSTFFNDILQENIKTPGQFIIVIDALDEITSQGARQEKIFRSLVDLVEKYSTSNIFKLVVTTRQSTWKLFANYIKNKNNWIYTNIEAFTKDGANIPPLNPEEIQSILDNTLNKKFLNRTLVHEMHPDLRDIISYPYFLQLFIQVYTPETKHLLNDQLSILSEFLKKQVYFSHFSDEKIDILNQIILLSKYGTRLVLKDELKSVYPIHLKLSGNYYTAYEELNSFGIILEETQVDSFGVYSKYLRIANHQLTSMLIVQNLIRKEHGLHFKLFTWIDKNLNDVDLQSSVLSTLFKLAYKEKLTDTLRDFFELSTNSLKSALLYPTIPAILRTDNYMRNSLIPHYAKQPIARKLLFENNIDFNHITDSFSLLIKTYLENSESKKDKLWANTLLTFTGFISIDTPLAIYHLNKIKQEDPNVLTPLIAGIWYANHIIYETFIGNKKPIQWIEKAIKQSTSYKTLTDKEDFAEFILMTLILINQISYFPKFIALNDEYTAPHHHSAMCFLFTKFYRLEQEGKLITSAENSTIEQIYGSLNPLQSYLGIIIGEILRSSYHLSSNNLEATNTCFRNAIELSGIAEYKLVEASLMKNLSEMLILLSENDKANECMGYVKSLWKLSGFKHELP